MPIEPPCVESESIGRLAEERIEEVTVEPIPSVGEEVEHRVLDAALGRMSETPVERQGSVGTNSA